MATFNNSLGIAFALAVFVLTLARGRRHGPVAFGLGIAFSVFLFLFSLGGLV